MKPAAVTVTFQLRLCAASQPLFLSNKWLWKQKL